MRFNKLVLGVILLVFSAWTTFANITPQYITLCLKVTNNKSNTTFIGGFYSTDFFDRGHYTDALANTKQCISHLYNQGFKNIVLTLEAVHAKKQTDHLIKINKSCFYIAPIDIYYYESRIVRTQHVKETWQLNLTEDVQGINNYFHIFDLTCEYNYSNSF